MQNPETIFITGASSGIGAALAKEYAAPGNRLILLGRNHARLEAIAAECERGGATTSLHAADVTDEQTMRAIILQEYAKQPIDLVFANAGISGGTSGVANEPEKQARLIFSTNIMGVMNSVLPALPLMQARGRGQIALLSSMAGYRGLPSAPAYSASKALVRVWGEALRGLHKSNGVDICVISPGYVTTPMTEVNEFPMPMRWSAEKAARHIRRKLHNNARTIVFPWPMAFSIAILNLLPNRLSDFIFSRLPGKPMLEKQGKT